MRKFFSLFVMLILGVAGAIAQTVGPATDFTGYSPAPANGEWAAGTQWFMIKNVNETSKAAFYLCPKANFLPKELPTAENIDSYLWALVGDADGGFVLYNKAEGPSKYLGVTSSSRGMYETTEDAHVWDLYTSLEAGKYLFIEHGTEHNAFNNNQQNGTLCTWNSDGALYGWNHTAENPKEGGDGGSNFQISGTETFNVVVEGNADGGVVIAGDQYGAGTVNTFTVLADAATAKEVEGYNGVVKVEGTTITVTYSEWPTWTVSISGIDEGILEEGEELSAFINDYGLVYDGDTFKAASVSESDVNAGEIVGYSSTVTIADNTITIVYKKIVLPVISAEMVEANKAYYIYTTARGGITVKNADDTRIWGTSEGGVNQTVSAENELMRFAFISYKDNLYLYSIAAGKFVGAGTEKTGALTSAPVDPIFFKDADATNGWARLAFSDSKNINLGGSNQMVIDGWNTLDAGNKFIIKEAADFDPTEVLASLQFATITVNYYIGERLYKSVENEVQIGETFQVEALPFTALAAEQEAFEVTEDKTINVTVTEDLPFEVSDPNSSDPDEMYKCGVLFVHANQTRYTFAQENEDGSFTPANDDNNRPESISPLYMWYITGNLIDGFKVWNYQADAALLASDNTVTFDDEGTAFELCTFSPDYNGNFDKLNADTNLVKSKKFTLHCDKGYVNSQSTEMKYWENADAGSTFVFAMVNDVNLDGTIDLNDVAALASCIAKGQPCYNGNINDDDVTSIADLTELIDLLQPVK